MRLIPILMLLTISCFGQNWGTRILFGSQFENTDSLRIRGDTVTDTLFADTLHTSVLDVAEQPWGVYNIAGYWTKVGGGTIDSLQLEVRIVDHFYKAPSKGFFNIVRSILQNTEMGHKFGEWKPVMVNKSSDELNKITIARSDSSWWHPCTGIQYRQYKKDTSTDTLLHQISDYRPNRN